MTKKCKKRMEKEVIKNNHSAGQPGLSRRERIAELFKEYGVPLKDMTDEMEGQTAIVFSPLPKTEQTDEAETCLRNLNRRKNS
jgi:hypothetical protein